MLLRHMLIACISINLLDSLQCIEVKCERYSQRNIKTFIIDLDLAPEKRFAEVATYFSSEIKEIIEVFKRGLDQPLINMIFEEFGQDLDNHLIPYPYREEISGIADVIRAPVGDVLFINLIYEFISYCTSVVARKETMFRGTQIFHGRNLDFDFAEYLSDVTFIAHYYKNNRLLYTSAQLAGYLGVLTGHKFNSFTFSYNQRYKGAFWINMLVAIADWQANPSFVVSREVMEKANSYTEAVQMLATAELIAPIYFIVGGVLPKEGAVITRDQIRLVDTLTLNATTSQTDGTGWYVLQTNFDHWTEDEDGRGVAGKVAMDAITSRELSASKLMDMLTAGPVCNRRTSYSVVMSAAQKANAGGFELLVH